MIITTITGVFKSMDIAFKPRIQAVWNYVFTDSGFLKLCIFGYANAHLPECFRHWTFFWNIELDMLPSDIIMSDLYSHLVYFAREFQAVKLIVLVVFGVVFLSFQLT